MSERDKQFLARVSWLQSLVSHRIVPVSFAKHLYQRCCSIANTPYDESAYQVMYDEASKQLSLLDLELRQFRDQQSGQRILALVNTKHDLLIQGATSYSALEISFIKKLVEEIFKAKKEAYAIPSLEAVRLASKLRTHMTRDATEELLKNLVDHRWIDYSADGIYTLSSRSLLELRNYLQNEFGQDYYHTCAHCKDLVTLGLGCSYTSRGCTVRYHLHCARSTIGSAVDDDDALHRLAGFNCPGCLRSWKSRPIGPRALNLSTSADQDTPFSSQGELSQVEASRSRRSTRRHVSDEDDDDEGDEDAVAQQLEHEEETQSESDQEPQPTPARVKLEPEQPLQSQRVLRRVVKPNHQKDSDEKQDVKPRKRAR